MKRIERARLIRDAVLSHPREEWRWSTSSDNQYLNLAGSGWHASLTTAFNGTPTTLPTAPSYLHALVMHQKAAPLPNVLDLWMTDRGKVLSVEWNDEEIRLISMKPGEWEAKFGISERDRATRKSRLREGR